MTDKVSIKEIAYELGITSEDVLEKAKSLGIEVKDAQSKVTMEEAEKIANYIMNGEDEKAIVPPKPKFVKAKSDTPKQETLKETSEVEVIEKETQEDDLKYTNTKISDYCTEVIEEKKIIISLKKLTINILHKTIVPLNIFEKYIIKVIDRADINKIDFVEKSQDENIIDILKIAKILSIDIEIVEKYIESLSISGSIKFKNSSLVVVWNENLKQWKKELIEENQKSFLLTGGDCKNFLSSTKGFQKNFIEHKYSEDNKIFYDYEIISVGEEKVSLKTSIILDKDSGELKVVFEQNDKVYTLSEEISSGTQLKSIDNKKLELPNQMKFSQEQIDAINATEKYILLKARAGSGKTAVITERVQRLLKEGINADEILLLAFNKDAVQEMNKRAGSCFNNAKTFHSFASSIVNPKNTAEEKRNDILFGNKLLEFLQNIIKKHKSICQCDSIKKDVEKELLDNKYYFTKKIERFISYAKQQALTSNELNNIIDKEFNLDNNLKCFLLYVNSIYKIYEEEKYYSNKKDFNDLLIDCIKEMTIHDVSKFKHIMIDEFQDFSLLFSNIIDNILKLNSDVNIFAVGDDWQAINGFAGANIDFFNSFKDNFKNAKLMNMLTNYRSPSEIVRYSNDILEGEDANYNSIGGEVVSINKECTEDLIIKIKAENPNKEIVVLVHNNYEKEDVEGVTFKTAHKSKGLQFDIVIIKDAYKFGYIHPDYKLYTIFEKQEESFMDEERRLFYVAVTRAKEKVYIFGKPQFK